MSIISIKANIQCDGCGNIFFVWLDSADKITGTLFDLAEDAVRGGVATNNPIGESTSVQDEKMLCPACTREADKGESTP